MSALPPKADINHRERDVGFVPFLLGRQSRPQYGRRAWTVISKKFNLPTGGLRSPAQKVYILFCTKSSPLMGLYVQSRAAPLRARGYKDGYPVLGYPRILRQAWSNYAAPWRQHVVC